MFTVKRTYTSDLPADAALEQMKTLAGFSRNLRAQGESSSECDFSFKVIQLRRRTTVKGKLAEADDHRKLSIVYRPTFKPLYWYLPVLLLFVINLFNAKSFEFNHEPVSRVKGILLAGSFFILFGLLLALFTRWSVTCTREKEESALQLKKVL